MLALCHIFPCEQGGRPGEAADLKHHFMGFHQEQRICFSVCFFFWLQAQINSHPTEILNMTSTMIWHYKQLIV